jgi:hypothetical protein
VHSAPLKVDTLPAAVETFTIELKAAGKGGDFTLTWGTTKLTAEIAF